jgi:uncharacterized repeat protein (TIGR03803 family)
MVHAQTLTTLASFNGTSGLFPSTTLAQLVRTHHWVQHPNGNLYGVAPYGGANNAGTVFQVTPSGVLTTLYSFCSLISNNQCTDGQTPQAALLVGSDGNLYGSTYYGGPNNAGTVFKITTSGALTTLYSFKGTTDGANPLGALAQDNSGDFWGTTYAGGNATSNAGTIFKITPGGSLTTIYTFCTKTGCPDGANPQGDLIQASGWDSNGNFYGNTYAGGNSNNAGTMFVITPQGALTTLYTFCSNKNCTDGSNPNVPMVQDAWGNLYGTTKSNGANAGGTLFVVFPWGQLRTLYHFCSKTNCTDGENPTGGPLLGQADGYIYGTTDLGGTNNDGTIYQVTPWGVLATLYNFCSKTDSNGDCLDGENPQASLVQASNGYFYSTTSFGGPGGYGTVFSLSPPDPTSGNSCNGSYYGTFNGNITVSNGQTCEFTDDGVVVGNIYVKGGSLILNNASVLGNLEIDGGTYALGPSLTIYSNVQVQNIATGPSQNTICGTSVKGDLQLLNNGTAVEIGSTAGACPGNSVGGNLVVNNNTAPVQVWDNTIVNNLQCQNNTSISGGADTAKQLQGQCSSF